MDIHLLCSRNKMCELLYLSYSYVSIKSDRNPQSCISRSRYSFRCTYKESLVLSFSLCPLLSLIGLNERTSFAKYYSAYLKIRVIEGYVSPTSNHIIICIKTNTLFCLLSPNKHLSCVMRKPTFCICENKDADQLRGNREAIQRLCFRYINSTIPLLSKSEISSL